MSHHALQDLRDRAAGGVITADDPEYDEARKVYNAMIDRRPRVIVQCTSANDVAAAVDHARENGLPLAIRGGGHSVPGFGTVDDGVVADLTGMRAISVDPASRTARAQGGATWGMFNDATHAHGLATTGGIISTTGVAGLTLGGGIGYLARGLGLACDNLLSAEVVTANGQIVTASDREHEDLFWALRGGSGNFGVCVSLEFRVHAVDQIYGGPMLFEVDDARAVMEWFREFIADAPEQFGGFPAWQIAPPLPFIPEERQGEMFAAFVACWAGPVEQGEAMLRPIHDAAPVVAEHVGPMPYPAINSAFDALLPPGLQQYWKANFLNDLSDGQIDAQLRFGPKAPTVNSTAHIYPINGAVHQVASDATAFAYRDANFATVIVGAWPDPADNEANIRWVRDYAVASAQYAEEGGYINFMSDDDQERIRPNYRGNYERLVEIKRTYDPDNLFRVNQNIAP